MRAFLLASLFTIIACGPPPATSERAKCALPSCLEDNPDDAFEIRPSGPQATAAMPDPSSKVTTPEPEVQQAKPDFSGHWIGQGLQSDGQTWPISITINGTNGERCAKVDYPDFPCGGYLNCKDPWTSDEVSAVEVLTYGLDQCINFGDFKLALTDADRLLFQWSADAMTAEGLLQRR